MGNRLFSGLLFTSALLAGASGARAMQADSRWPQPAASRLVAPAHVAGSAAILDLAPGRLQVEAAVTGNPRHDKVETDPVERDEVRKDSALKDAVEGYETQTDPVHNDPVEIDAVGTDVVHTDPVETD